MAGKKWKAARRWRAAEEMVNKMLEPEDTKVEDELSGQVTPQENAAEGDVATRFRTARQSIQEKAGKVRDGAVTDLLTRLDETLNNPDASDVVFVCKNGERVYGSRWLLSARCRVFSAMFGHEMRESKLVEIPLVQFSSGVLLAMFEYLYTGRIDSHPPLNWRMGLEMIGAASFFMVPDVVILTQDFLWSEAERAIKDPKGDLVVAMLNEAFEFQEGWDGRNLILGDLVSSLGRNWFREDCSQGFSEASLNYILRQRKHIENTGRETHLLEEYYTFRQIVLSQVRQNLPTASTEVEEILRRTLPIAEDEAGVWSAIFKYPNNLDGYSCAPSKGSDSHDPVAVLNSRLGTDMSKEPLQRLLSHIDWSRIPAMLLMKVVYPMQVVVPHTLFQAIAFQAMHQPLKTLAISPACKWKGAGDLSYGSEGRLSCKSEDGSRRAWGRAVASLPMPRSYGTYEWQFKILNNEADYITLGIICGSDSDPWNEHALQRQSLFSCPATKLLSISCGQGITHVSDAEPKVSDWEFWQKFLVEPKRNSSIKFTLDASEKTCSVSFGDSFTTVWRNLPDATYHPVVGFIHAKHAEIQISVMDGFAYV